MAFDFPNAPAVNDIYSPAGGPAWQWNGVAWVQVASSAYVAKSGDTMTGNLTIAPSSGDALVTVKTPGAATPWLVLDKGASGQNSGIRGKLNGLDRWLQYIGDGSAESSGNAGSNYSLYRCNDSGGAIEVALGINRATGNANIARQLSLGDSLTMQGGANILVTSGNYYLNGTINWIRQGHLVTGFSSQSTAAIILIIVLPGGQWGFMPVCYSNSTAVYLSAALTTHQSIAAASGLTARNIDYSAAGANYWTIGVAPAGGSTTYANQRYMSASPPYDMGDGEVPLWAYALMENGTDTIRGASVANDPPWANNGPTDIRPDDYRNGVAYKMVKDVDLTGLSLAEAVIAYAEAPVKEIVIDMAMKMKDMAAFPHPFITDPSVLDGTCTPVLLDPMSPILQQLAAWHGPGRPSVCDLLHKNGKPADIKIGNTALKRAGPQGLMIVDAKWR